MIWTIFQNSFKFSHKIVTPCQQDNTNLITSVYSISYWELSSIFSPLLILLEIHKILWHSAFAYWNLRIQPLVNILTTRVLPNPPLSRESINKKKISNLNKSFTSIRRKIKNLNKRNYRLSHWQSREEKIIRANFFSGYLKCLSGDVQNMFRIGTEPLLTGKHCDLHIDRS